MGIRITLRYFAVARERAGLSQEKAELPDGSTVGSVLRWTAERHPDLQPVLRYLRASVNQEFVGEDTLVPDGAEVALIPPVAGGSSRYQVVDRPLRLEDVVDAVNSDGRGAVVTFTGAVRDKTRDRSVLRLEYEAYAEMAEKALEQIGRDAEVKWPGAQLAIEHRVGVLVPGDLAVVIAAAAPHRAEAFEACRYAIERLKLDVPIWKKEHFEDGVTWVGLGS